MECTVPVLRAFSRSEKRLSEPRGNLVTLYGMAGYDTDADNVAGGDMSGAGYGERRDGRGAWIAFEGIDGCGKSTQARILAEKLEATLTREPGNTDVGARIRELLLHQDGEMNSRCEVLLFAADRAEHIERVVKPVVLGGGVVVSDRSVWSSAIYQGVGRGLGVESVLAVNDWASDGMFPDIVVYLRGSGRGVEELESPDRIESSGRGFYEAVEAGFEKWAQQEDWIIVNRGSLEETASLVEAEVRRRLW